MPRSAATSLPADHTDNEPTPLARWKKLLFAAVVFVGVPLLAEATVRIRDAIRFGSSSPAAQLYQSHPQLGKVLRPGAVLSGAATDVRINKHGFRGPELVVPKPAGTFRIACLGGSTTFGTYSTSNDTTWPARLQEKLQGHYPRLRVEVINAGVPGYRLANSRINLCQRVAPLEPDLVVIYHACNDIIAQQAKEYASQSHVAARPMIGTAWLTRHSLLFEKLAKNIQIMRTPANEPQRHDQLPDRGVENFRCDLEALLDDCQSNNIPALLCTMATQFRVDQPQDVQRKAAGTALYYNKHLSIKGLLRAYDTINAQIQLVAQDRGLPCADVFDAVPGDAHHFGDSVHLTDIGCQRVADCIFAALTTAGTIPPTPQIAARP